MNARTLTLLIPIVVACESATAQVPVLLKDINPSGNSNPGLFTCVGDMVYFSATDGVNGMELWKTDGSEAGTLMVKDINPGTGSSAPRDLMLMNGVLHFIATGAGMEPELWRTDGTEAGTQLVLSRTDVPGLLEWITFVAFPGSGPGGSDRIFFRGYDADHGRELWSTDGTPAGTLLFLDINPGTASSSFQDPMAHDGMLYFTANDGLTGSEPWMSDGTVAGTHLIAETIAGPASSGTSPSNYRAAGGLIFFRAGTSATGDELWATDGTVPGTGLVKDIYPGANSSLPSNLLEHNGQLHLRAFPTTGSSTALIWQSDGTQSGTVSWNTFGYTNPDNFCSHDGALYVTALGTTTYRQLWRTDNTAPGTYEIPYPGSDVISPFSNAAPMLSCNGTLFFRANYLTSTGLELYVLNLTTGSGAHDSDGIRIYPIPATDGVWIDLGEASDGNATVTIIDLQGRVIGSSPSLVAVGTGRFRVPLEGVAPGTYLIHLKVGGKRWSKRIIKA